MLKPLVKWAGGKRQLLRSIVPMLPETFERYIEPFAGGCALLVELYNRGMLKQGIISDVNGELVNLYRVVKGDPADLIEYIKAENFSNDKKSYYDYRAKFNSIRGGGDHRTERAGIFLYLNRLGYNGLWRVNSSGDFNVPFGRYVNPSMPEEKQIFEFSSMLSRVEIYNLDFSSVCGMARKDDLVYLDPPYLPVSKSSSFTSYSRNGFPLSEQERLYGVCETLNLRGVKFIFNNSYTETIAEMYSKFNRKRVRSSRMINRNADSRKGHFDLIGSNF